MPRTWLRHRQAQQAFLDHAHRPPTLRRYFESIKGVPKIQEGYNPATWMLDISTLSSEKQMGVDLAQVYEGSQQRRCLLPDPSMLITWFGWNQ